MAMLKMTGKILTAFGLVAAVAAPVNATEIFGTAGYGHNNVDIEYTDFDLTRIGGEFAVKHEKGTLFSVRPLYSAWEIDGDNLEASATRVELELGYVNPSKGGALAKVNFGKVTYEYDDLFESNSRESDIFGFGVRGQANLEKAILSGSFVRTQFESEYYENYLSEFALGADILFTEQFSVYAGAAIERMDGETESVLELSSSLQFADRINLLAGFTKIEDQKIFGLGIAYNFGGKSNSERLRAGIRRSQLVPHTGAYVF